jgi:histidinol phosphatase-like PHP family hydrolase
MGSKTTRRSKAEKYPGLIFEANDLDLANLPRIDCHLHTSWTDGTANVEDVFRVAVERNLTTILYSEHSRKTSTDWFPKFAAEVRALPSSPCNAYVGTEVKVESRDGDIDTSIEISGLCEFVMASVHRFIAADGTTMQFAETDPNQAVDLEYALTWAVLPNPQVDILGHMFGMSYRRFGVVPPDEKIIELITRAAEFGVAVEVNSHYHPNLHKMIRWCQECNARITFGSNAHSPQEVGTIARLLGQEKPYA